MKKEAIRSIRILIRVVSNMERERDDKDGDVGKMRHCDQESADNL